MYTDIYSLTLKPKSNIYVRFNFGKEYSLNEMNLQNEIEKFKKFIEFYVKSFNLFDIKLSMNEN